MKDAPPPHSVEDKFKQPEAARTIGQVREGSLFLNSLIELNVHDEH